MSFLLFELICASSEFLHKYHQIGENFVLLGQVRVSIEQVDSFKGLNGLAKIFNEKKDPCQNSKIGQILLNFIPNGELFDHHSFCSAFRAIWQGFLP